MKQAILINLLILSLTSGKAQTMQEWFDQKSTQNKYLVQQVAALQVYIAYLKKGYKVADMGLTTIKDLKQGHLNLDSSFFNRLKIVNPKIANYAKVGEMLSFKRQITKQQQSITSFMKSQPTFSSAEVNSIKQLMKNLLMESESVFRDLTNVITSGKQEMSDDERMSCIDRLHAELMQNRNVMNEVNTDVKILSLQRAREVQDGQSVRLLYRKK